MTPDKKFEALEYEIAAEKAAALGRSAAKLEEALLALRELDAAGAATGGRDAREELVAHAAERLWYYVVHREALGWHRHDEALAILGVPAEIQARMGPRRNVT
jgi:hypothetical protein